MSDAPGSKQKAFRIQLQISGWPCHPTVFAVPNTSAMGTCYCPWGHQKLPQPCTNLPHTTKGSIRLGWKLVCPQARKEAERIWQGGRGVHCIGPHALRCTSVSPPRGNAPTAVVNPKGTGTAGRRRTRVHV